ncbi:hypothetical protein ABID23_000828 [Bartonella silvatica]|uniref:Uncharacterized protein n=1 Tax=Bartonella silvatica TaxID=357760 RepID=A0ABV2HH71_9HYPH
MTFITDSFLQLYKIVVQNKRGAKRINIKSVIKSFMVTAVVALIAASAA